MNRCDWYVVLWCIVQLEEVIHIEGAISQGIQALLLGWALYEGIAYMLPNRRFPLMLQATSVLTFMYVVYGLVFIVEAPAYFSGDPHYVYMKSFLVSFMPLFLFYKYSQQGYLTEERFCAYLGVFLCTVGGRYIQQYLSNMSKTETDGTTNNYGYSFLTLLPWVFFLYKKRLLQYVTLAIMMLFVLFSMKRGAIAIGAVCVIWFLVDSIRHSTSNKHKMSAVFFGATIVVGAVFAVSYLLATSDYFNSRIEATQKGDSSGRDRLYSTLIDAFVNDDSYIHLIFGRGAYATFDIIHKMAHNDWLETATNNGFLGISCMLFFIISMFFTARQGKKKLPKEIGTVLLMMTFTFVSQTFFSMAIQGMPIYVSMIIAYVAAIVNIQQENNGETLILNV